MTDIDVDYQPHLPPRRIVLVRHGQTTPDTTDYILRGRLETPLDKDGREQVRELAQNIAAANPELIVCGPLKRALQTAGAIVEAVACPLKIDKRLIDRDFGEATSMTPSQVIKNWGSIEYVPGAEPITELRSRVMAAMCQDRGASPIVMVGHDVINRMILHEVSGLDWNEITQSTACWNIIDWSYDGGWKIVAMDKHGPIDEYL